MIDFNSSRPNSEQPNLSGITGIVRRLVLDGALSEENARKALAEAPKTKLPVHVFLTEKKLISAASLALANVAGSLAQVLVLLTAWSLTTVARFALLRRWVFRGRA